MEGYRVAVVGAGGLVGRRMVRLLEERNFPVRDLRLLATARSAGGEIAFRGTPVVIEETRPAAFAGCQLVLLGTPSDVSRELAPQAVAAGAVCIDESSAFRMDPDVPLVVPEVNPQAAEVHRGILASPNCSTIQLVVVLARLHAASPLRRVVATTYQAVSGVGWAGMQELRRESGRVLEGQDARHTTFPRPIAFNLVPHIDRFGDEGYTREEWKMVRETRKILGVEDLPVSVTCVRVPVFVGHAEAVLVETERPLTPEDVQQLLTGVEGIELLDGRTDGAYPTPLDAAGEDRVLVGRIRRDLSSENGIWLWIVADNLRKGAATNAVQIAELLVQGRLV